MYYLVTIGYEDEDAKGNLKKVKTKYLLEAESVEEATIVAARFGAEDMRHSEVISIVKSPVTILISPETYPKCYKS